MGNMTCNANRIANAIQRKPVAVLGTLKITDGFRKLGNGVGSGAVKIGLVRQFLTK
jgi:hypothetical protein